MMSIPELHPDLEAAINMALDYPDEPVPPPECRKCGRIIKSYKSTGPLCENCFLKIFDPVDEPWLDEQWEDDFIASEEQAQRDMDHEQESE